MGGFGPLRTGAPALLALLSVSAAAQRTATVGIADNTYAPPEVRIKPGDSVRWLNNERRTSHSVLFLAENGLESTRMFPGEQWERRFERPGRYEYTCGPHPEMKGLVIVE